MLLLRLVLAACLSVAVKIDWSAEELEPYEIASTNEIFSGKTFVHLLSNSYGSIGTIYVGLNKPLGDDIEGCEPGLDICGIFKGADPDDDETISFGPDYKSVKYEPIWKGVSITLRKKRQTLDLSLICFPGELSLVTGSLYGEHTYTTIYTKAGCLKKSWEDRDPFLHRMHQYEEPVSWFVWFLIFLVIFVIAFAAGGALYQYRLGNATSFRSALHEFLRNGVDLFRGIPPLIRQIIEKATSTMTERSGYTAL